MKYMLAAAAAGILVCMLTTVRCGAYTLYARGRAVAALDKRYSEELTGLNSRIDELLEQREPSEASESGASDPADLTGLYEERATVFQEYRAALGASGRELAEKLMDYDVALKRLRVLVSRYESGRRKTAALEISVRTGECGEKTLSAEKERNEGLYREIRSLMFGIGVMKAEIEKITGEPLKDSFDFDSVYLIADVPAMNVSELEDRSRTVPVCAPEESESGEYEAPDGGAAYAAAVQAYYMLGEALHDYLSAAADVKTGEKDYRLGRITEEELAVLSEAREDTFLAAAQAKADFSKALLAFDESVGWSLTFGYGISPEEVHMLRKTLTEARRGTGLWFAVRGEKGTVLCAAALPAGTYRAGEDDTAVYEYTVRYGKKTIGSAPAGAPCVLSEISRRDGEDFAEVTFYRDGMKTGAYRLDIFSPYGGFIG